MLLTFKELQNPRIKRSHNERMSSLIPLLKSSFTEGLETEVSKTLCLDEFSFAQYIHTLPQCWRPGAVNYNTVSTDFHHLLPMLMHMLSSLIFLLPVAI